MRIFKRIVSLTLLLCTIITLLPALNFVKAAEVHRKYVLDTDGIDPNATYLIVVPGDDNVGNALKLNTSGSRDFQNQTLTISTDQVTNQKYIESGFENETACLFQFSGSSSGTITSGSYSLNLSDSNFVVGSPENSLTFTNVGNGQYRIHYRRLFSNYYLRFNNGSWARNTSSSSIVYLYKLTEELIGYDVTYHGNGNTSGIVPEGETMLSPGATHTLQEPTELRKDIGDDTWLFLCWNTLPDGSGIEYRPGDTITVTGDIQLYADWYLQTKHTLSMITYLDGNPMDVDKISGLDKHFYARLENDENAPYIPLKHSAEGTYSAKVADNGTYVIYSTVGESDDYEEVHGHKVVIFNQDGSTECMHYSVIYDPDGGSWNGDENPRTEIHHFQDPLHATEMKPTLAGNRFLGWKDQDNNVYAPGQHITAAIDRHYTLLALWEKAITVTVNIEIDHKADEGGADIDPNMHDLLFTLLRYENGGNLPLEEKILSEGYTYNEETKVTTYTLVYAEQPQGEYRASGIKSHYESTVTHTGAADEDQVINIKLKYVPNCFDLNFNVKVNADNEAEQALMPKAVNVRISYWGYDAQNKLGWHIITQQESGTAPSTVTIANDGTGTAFFPVLNHWSGTEQAYEYRLEVTSFVMPDGTIVRASGDKTTFQAEGSGLYTATVSIENGGRIPTYPAGSNTSLPGSYFDSEGQNGIPTVTVDITPFTVTLDAGNGTLDGQQSVTFENLYRYPDLEHFTAVPNAADRVFIGWVDEDGNPVHDLSNTFLTENVTLYARYNDNFDLSGTVTVDTTYLENGQTIFVNNIDLPKSVLVVLQKKVGSIYNDIDSATVTLTYEKDAEGQYIAGSGTYEFKSLPNDSTEYRVQVLTLNYNDSYDNNGDDAYAQEESLVVVDMLTSSAQVNAYLDFAPDSYQQSIKIDTSRIHADLRPTGVMAQVIYRDLGDVHNYQTITQHADGGIKVDFHGTTATTSENVWKWHYNGAPYEYQVQISTVYGNNVLGAYTEEGLPYNEDRPFTIVYGTPNNYLRENLQGGAMLEATLVPKEYAVILDPGTTDPVYGLEKYMVDDGTGNTRYAFVHTWSFAEEFTAYPFREGHVFTGWASPDESEVYQLNDVVHVGKTLDHNITLVAQWEKLTGTDCAVRYLELNTDKVLQGASIISGSTEGSTIVAATTAPAIQGYVYAGAMIGEDFIPKDEDPALTVTNDPTKNVMVIYYLPDGSDGYTEQVESNLEINKSAILENNGTYTITLDTYTKDNPITTLIQQNTPLDIVLVLDQSGSLVQNNYLQPLEDAVENFVTLVAQHGRQNEVDHRIAIVGYASNDVDGDSDGNKNKPWLNTGVFDSNGVFHKYNVNGFNYTELTDTSSMNAEGPYYTKIVENGKDKYLLLTYHSTYYHLLTEEEARVATIQGNKVYGYVYNDKGQGEFTELTRNSSGLWLYGDKKLYSQKEFFTYHTDVWTHRNGMDRREIHAYGLGTSYKPTDGHEGVYTRTETTEDSYYQSIYEDALVPVSVGASGSGGTNPGLINAINSLGSDGATRASYGMEMANAILAANPLGEEEKDRLRLIVMFTDGEPGYNGFSSDSTYYNQAVTEANSAIKHAYTAKHDYNAYVYAIGLYKSNGVDENSEVAYYMNALSSNYLNAQSMDDVHYTLLTGNLQSSGTHYALVNGSYYQVKYGSRITVSGYNNKQTCWYYTIGSTNYLISTSSTVAATNGVVSNFAYPIYKNNEYAPADASGYYTTTESADHLKDYFEDVLRDITTKITTEIVLKNDTILRDIMNQGLVMTNDTVITVYTQEGNYDLVTGKINWAVDGKGDPILDEQVRLLLSTGQTSITDAESGVAIHAYNLDAENPTNPNPGTGEADYHPHAVDITGYNFSEWYISASHTHGFKMVVTISHVEARDDVEWSRSTTTNHDQSGLWLPADEHGNRQLLLPFDQPTTIFVERTYVLDYGKEFTLTDWYFDDENGKDATPIHIDCDIESGMNGFDPLHPNTSNAIDGKYGNTKYGNVQLRDGKVTYSPTAMNWGGYDQFYVFGNTWRNTVITQDANKNGNLWNKVTIIPANNIYYEDSFITTKDTTQNGIEGFTFTGAWSTVGGEGSGNTELPEHSESESFGGVHGWVDSLADDLTFTDGSAHVTGTNKEMGAKVDFTFTGTGVEVYTRTNATSGMVVAVLNRKVMDENGNTSTVFVKSLAIDNLAVSGDYYHIPTVSFKMLPYGTYTLQLIATAATSAETGKRYEYYIDGVRVLNPLGNTTNYQIDAIKNAYDLETNSIFTPVRDILLNYGDFNLDLPNSEDGKSGAVFIDWVPDDQGGALAPEETGVPTYEIGIYKDLGPKNEVYLSAGQAIVLNVAEGNHYYLGLKSLTGAEVTVNVTGINQANPTSIKLSHTTDMYYKVTPVDGYIVIQNGNTDGAILSITNLRTTNLTSVAPNGGVLQLKPQEAIDVVTDYTTYMLQREEEEEPTPPTTEPDEVTPSPEDQAQANIELANALFPTVRQWLDTTDQGGENI